MSGGIYSKPILFTVVATAVILIGTVATMFYPMFTPGMHPKLDGLKPYTALELTGKDIYQREGCNNCHTQTVRPLRTEVMRYGEYSKAGEFAYDRPFLWGSKRTGPDLARIGGKYPDAWHERHFESPQVFFPKSNMPSYGWLADRRLSPDCTRRNMDVNGFPYTEEEITALAKKTDLDALVAYMQVIGTAVVRETPVAVVAPAEESNPVAGDPTAAAAGGELYEEHCEMCHGENAEGDIGPGIEDYDADDSDYFETLAAGVEGEMPGFGSQLERREIWSIITWLRSLNPDAGESSDGAGEEAAGDAAAGEAVYKAKCAFCHGADLEGGMGPSLADHIFDEGEPDGSDSAYIEVITNGRTGGMPKFDTQLNADQIRDVVTFIRSRQTD